MIEHAYIQKIKNGKAVNKDEKLDYINTLTFDSNQIVLNNNNFNMSQFLKEFNDIVIDTKNLYVYLDLKELTNEKELSDQDYKNIYNQSINNIDYIFGNERIILHSSRLFKINKKNMALKTFLIYSESGKSFDIYQQNQTAIKNKIALLSNLSKWDFRSLITAIHQMQLYKTLYKDLFSNNNKNRITNFIENAKNDKIYGVGLIKGNVKKDKRGNGEKYTVNSFKIEADFLNYKGDFSITSKNIIFKLNIVTRVFATKEKSATLSNIKTYNDKSVQMAILGQVDSISNYYDKKSISFNVHKFDDTKFHLYCLSIDMLKKNVFTRIIKGNLEQSFPILENEDFYKNNIQKQLIIGVVFEEHLKSKIEEYDFYFNEMLKNKSKWTNSDKVDIKHIQLEKNLEKEELIKILKNSNCDCFICLTDIDDYNEDKEENSNNIIPNDYYKIIKNYILKQNLENKQPFITQGLIVPNPELVEDNIEDDIVEEEDKKDKFKDKIKTAFYELCTKYIFYTNKIKLTSSFKENDYLIISFNAPSKLCSCIKIQAKDNNIVILSKELLQLTSTNGNGFRKEENLIKWLSKKIDNTDEVLKEVSSYDDFIIYDLKEKNFLLCSSTQTYLLSDNHYALRKELILEHRTGKTYSKLNKQGEMIDKESTAIMSLLIPLYNVSKTMPSQIFLFEINNEQYYFVGNEMKKTQEHPQSPLVKMYFNENNPSLLDLYFSVITANVVRNGLNTKTTLFEKFSKLHMVN